MGVTFAVNVTACPGPSVTVAGVTAIEAVLLTTVTVADALFAALAFEMPVTVTVAGLGMVAGAVYKPVVEIDPQAEAPAAQVSCQVAAVLELPVTVAVNCRVWLTATDALVGVTLMITSGGALLQAATPDNPKTMRTHTHFAMATLR